MGRGRVKSCFRVILFAALAAAIPCRADFIPPDQVPVHTETYRPQKVLFSPGRYYYDISWENIPVASAEVDINYNSPANHSVLRVEARVKTAKVIDLLYRLRHISQSFFHIDSFRPIKYISDQTENSRERYQEIVFREDGQTVSQLWKNNEPADAFQFTPNNQMLDPISAAFLARSIPIDVGTKASFDVFNGTHRFLISFDVVEKEQIKIGDAMVEAFRAVPSVQKLTDSEGEKRLKSATLWISADENRQILKLESKVLIGRVKAKFDHFEPLNTANQPSVTTSIDRNRLPGTDPAIRTGAAQPTL